MRLRFEIGFIHINGATQQPLPFPIPDYMHADMHATTVTTPYIQQQQHTRIGSSSVEIEEIE